MGSQTSLKISQRGGGDNPSTMPLDPLLGGNIQTKTIKYSQLFLRRMTLGLSKTDVRLVESQQNGVNKVMDQL